MHFLGMDISSSSANRGRFRLSVFDKRKAFSFPVRRYPQMTSLIPPTIVYGVFVAQLHRGFRICTAVDDFLDFSVDVFRRLVANGCASGRLFHLFMSFITRVVACNKWRGYTPIRLVRELKSRVHRSS